MASNDPHQPAAEHGSETFIELATDYVIPEGTLLEERIEILRRVGRGGMSSVYEAQHKITGKRVAVKVMGKQLSTNAAYKQRFLREAKVMAHLSHPSIAGVQAVGVFEDRLYLVIDFVEGRTLQEELAAGGAMPEARVLNIAAQICDALVHAHSHSVVHRDLKPGNIMLDSSALGDSVKLLDFGVATWLDRDREGRITQTGEVFGSPHYMSPEQAQGMPLDGRSDIYSLGCILYEMLSGALPFDGANLFEVLSKQMKEDAPALSTASEGMQYVVARAMAKLPAERYQSASEMKEDLVRAASGEAMSPLKRQSANVVPHIPKPRLKVVVAFGALILTVAGILYYSYVTDSQLASETENSPVTRELSPEREALQRLFVDRDTTATVPGHQRAVKVMESLRAGGPLFQREARVREAIELLKAVNLPPNANKLSPAEHAMVLQRLAVLHALLIPPTNHKDARISLLNQSRDYLSQADRIYAELNPEEAKSFQTSQNLGFVNWMFGKTTSDRGALDRAAQYYRYTRDRLAAKKAAAEKASRKLTPEEDDVYQHASARLDNIQSIIEHDNGAMLGTPSSHTEQQLFQGLYEELMMLGDDDTTTVPQHKNSMTLFHRALSGNATFDHSKADLQEARERIQKAIASVKANNLQPGAHPDNEMLVEFALMNHRLGIYEAHLMALEKDDVLREKLHRQALKDIARGTELYNQVHPGYAASFEPPLRVAWINQRLADTTNDLAAYDAARDAYGRAQRILQALKTAHKHTWTPHEQWVSEMVFKRQERILRKKERIEAQLAKP